MQRQDKSILRNMIAARLCRFRKEKRLTQEDMAERLSITPRSYSDLERGKCGCSAPTAIRFLLLLGDEDAVHLLHSIYEQMEEGEPHDIV